MLAQQPQEITNSIGMKLVLIPNGKFMMGSAQDEVGRWDGEIQHEVTISQDYYLGVNEVTQAQTAQNSPDLLRDDREKLTTRSRPRPARDALRRRDF
jgi:hypothetical protein